MEERRRTIMSSASKCDRCVSCGAVVPEGTQVCVNCQKGERNMENLIERIKNRIENELHNIYELSTAIEIINEEQAKDPQEDIQKDELLEILDKIDFFNQRAGRELWSEKNREVQDIDISNISDDIEKLRSYIAKAQPIVRSAEQRIETVKNIGLIG